MKAICMGVLIMDMFPEQYGVPLAHVTKWLPMAGGAPANVAVALQRMGVETAYWSQVGDDAFGLEIIKRLQDFGVDTASIRKDAIRRTTLNFHAKPTKDETEYLFYRNPGADTAFEVSQIELDKLAEVSVLHFDALCLTDAPMRDSTYKAVAAAREAGCIISFDVNYRSAVWPGQETAVRRTRDMLPHCDVVKLNQEEAALLYPGYKDERVIDMLLSQGPQIVLLTLGERGSLAAQGDLRIFTPSLTVPVADTIGCGDAYAAGFLYGVMTLGLWTGNADAEKLKCCAAYGTALAACTAQRKGALEALPDRAAFFEQYNRLNTFLKESV